MRNFEIMQSNYDGSNRRPALIKRRNYEVVSSNYDGSRPWIVIATFRSFNRVIARYADRSNAMRRARDMNKRSTIRQ